MSKATTAERIAAKVMRDESTGCLVWIGATNADGYAQISVNNRHEYVHRLVLEAAMGTLPIGSVVDHTCRNRACVEVGHLHAVTQKQNLENQSSAGYGTSGHRGVSWCAQTGLWKVRVNHNKRPYWGGRYVSLDAATNAAVALRNRLFTNNLDDH